MSLTADFALSARFARRELRGGIRGFRVFLACLALGIAAIAAVGLVRESIEAGIAEQGAELLGGDAEIQLTYRFASAEERAVFDRISSAVSEIVDFRSMAVVTRAGKTERGLVQVKAVDSAYPLYGTTQLEPAQLFSILKTVKCWQWLLDRIFIQIKTHLRCPKTGRI